MKIIRLSTAFFILSFLTFIQVNAQKLSGEAYYPISRLKSEIEKSLTPSQPLEGVLHGSNINLPDGFPFVLSDVKYQYKWSSAKINIRDDANIMTSIADAEVTFFVPKIDINTTIIKYIDGAIINIKLQSECSNITLIAKTNHVNLKLSRSNEADSVYDFSLLTEQLDYEKPSLQISSFECTNIRGLEEEIKENIFENFNNLNAYNDLMIEKINIVIKQKIYDTLTEIDKSIQENFNKSKLSLNQKIRIKSLDSEKLTVQFALNKDLDREHLVETIPEKIAIGSYSILFNVNKEEFDSFINGVLKFNAQKIELSSKQIKPLDKLTKSRLQQFFIWPALKKRKKGQELILRPVIEKLSFKFKQEDFAKNISAQISTGLWIIDEDKPMIYFRSRFSAQTFISENSEIITTVSGLQTKSFWDDAYLKAKKCSKRISTKIIDYLAQQTFNQNWAKQNINVIVFGATQRYRLKDIFHTKSNSLFIRLDDLK